MPRHSLTPLQLRFIEEYPKDLHGTAAAQRAGYNGSEAGAAAQACKWLKTPKIARALAAQQAPRIAASGLTAQKTLDAINAQVDADIRDLYDENGDIKPLRSLTKAQAAMIVGVEHVMKNAEAGDGQVDRVLKIKLAPRDRYVEMAAKHFKLLTDVLQVVDGDKIIERLNRGRAKYAKVTKR